MHFIDISGWERPETCWTSVFQIVHRILMRVS
jgi:hypothetical protein